MNQSERDELARQNMDHVERIIAAEKRKIGLRDPAATDELRSYALEGLASALSRFDPERNVKFMQYAAPRIRGAIYDGLRQSGWFPRELHRKIKYFRKAEDIVHSHYTDPPPRDAVETVHRLADTLKDLATAYVTTYVAEESESRESLSSPPSAEVDLERQQLRHVLISHMSRLPPRQYRVVFDYFFRDLGLKEIAEDLNISKGWASKLMRAALTRLRKELESGHELLGPCGR